MLSLELMTEHALRIARELADQSTGRFSREEWAEKFSSAIEMLEHEGKPVSELGDFTLVLGQLHLEYNDQIRDEIWDPSGASIVIPDEFESVLSTFLETPYWDDKATTTTIMNLIVFTIFKDILPSAVSDLIRIRGGHEVRTQMLDGSGSVIGTPDYVLGQRDRMGFGELFPSVVFLKKDVDRGKGLPQLIAYMVGIGQSRERNGYEVGTIYGVLTDGMGWRFMKLNGNHSQGSAIYTLRGPGMKLMIYQFLHDILSAAVSTPLRKRAAPDDVFGPMLRDPDHSS